MEKDIKNYLHLYLGCEVQTTARKESTQGQRMGYKTGKMLDVDVRCKATSVDIDDVPIDFNFSEVKPILTRIKDLTQEQQVHILKLCRHINMDYPLSDYTFELSPEKTALKISISNDWYEDTIFIGLTNAAIWTNESTFFRVSAEIYRYFLSEGIDIFGLIDSELAIDKNTLNT